jgi:transcriptional regulator with GAF, ATPase, and Fis domain
MKDEKSLLDEICKIIVEIGGHRMAWVGSAENNKYKSVQPLAQNGFEEGYLEKAAISWSNKTAKGRGPTGTSIRTKRTVIGFDFLKDRKLLPWRDQAVKRGYRSSIALPLKSKDAVFGALMIYSSETGVFDKEEIKILEGLANDISFGIGVFRAKEAERKAEEQLVESYKYLGTINRKISILLDLERHIGKSRAKGLVIYILRLARNISGACTGMVYCLREDRSFHLVCYEGIDKTKLEKLERIKRKDFLFLRNLAREKVVVKGAMNKHMLARIDVGRKLTYFLALPLIQDKLLKGFIFLGFDDRVSMDSNEIDFFDVFAIHSSMALLNNKSFK